MAAKNRLYLTMNEQLCVEISAPPQKEGNPDTDTSLNRSQEPQSPQLASGRFSKKRIGPYSYRFNDVIGSGFSSTVYRGYKDNDKTQVVAIKVVQLNQMKHHRKKLLDNEIHILKMLNHPNILAFKDIYYTANNCYIITEYCDCGSLQNVLEGNFHFDWRQAAYEIGLACQYLAHLNIIHRDIKPANVLLKNGVFKLSDFGFSFKCPTNQPVKQGYLIGSPLYMPLQSLSDHIYSSKSDSFALGVLLYYLAAKRFPWKGKDKHQLIYGYQKKKYSKSGISHLAPRVKHLIASLLQMQHQKRIHLNDCNFEVFLHLGPAHHLSEQLSCLKECQTQQIKLCQYVHSLLQNYHPFIEINSYLPEFMTRHLSSLMLFFQWHLQPDLNQIKQLYSLHGDDPKFSSDDYYWLSNCLKDTIRVLSSMMQEPAQVMLQKLLKYQQVIEGILFESHEEIIRRIKELDLHESFSFVQPDPNYITSTLTKIDFYQL